MYTYFKKLRKNFSFIHVKRTKSLKISIEIYLLIIMKNL